MKLIDDYYNPENMSADTKERSEIETHDTWNLKDIYESDEQWMLEKEKFKSNFHKISEFKGKLSSSSLDLLNCLELKSELTQELIKLYSYANLKSDEDTRNTKYRAMQQEINQIATEFGSIISFIDPEILKIKNSVIEDWLEKETGLSLFKFYLNNLKRVKKHTLSDKEEKILAEASLIADAPHNIFKVFSNADFQYPQAQLSSGKVVKIDLPGYNKYRTLKNRDDRKVVFDTFWGRIREYQGTFGEQLNANIKKDIFFARARKYKSSLHSSLNENNIPVDVYHSLIANVKNNLNAFKRYLNIKRRMLNVKRLEYYDIYAPVVAEVDLEYNFEEAKKLVLESSAYLGDEYQSRVRKALDERWIDIYPNVGKRSGAYSSGDIYDVHPYILLNYNGQYNDVSTLAHELGHAMHSYYSNLKQPFPTAGYSIFVAEVASTINEVMLIHTVLNKVKDENVKLSLLMNHLDGFKGTLFRQTQFAEFEFMIHQRAESGIPMTGEDYTHLYGELLKHYYGHEDGVCNIDDVYAVEWAYIPHFYYNYYVYQYATSFTATMMLSEKILTGEPGAVNDYLNFISSGGSDYPINILKNTEIDMTTSEPFEYTMRSMNRILDEIEEILNKHG